MIEPVRSFQQMVLDFVPSCQQEEAERAAMLEYIRLFPHNILTRQNPIAHFTASGLILDQKRTRVLLIHHNIFQTWCWIGGHADGNPDPLQVVLQEAQEETGLCTVRPFSEAVVSLDLLPVHGHVKNGVYVSSHLHLNLSYLLCADGGEKPACNPGEASGAAWFFLAQLDTLTPEENIRNIYHKMLARL